MFPNADDFETSQQLQPDETLETLAGPALRRRPLLFIGFGILLPTYRTYLGRERRTHNGS